MDDSYQENGRAMLEWLMFWGASMDQVDFETVFQAAMVAFVKFWSHPSRRHLVDEDICKICFADTVDFFWPVTSTQKPRPGPM